MNITVKTFDFRKKKPVAKGLTKRNNHLNNQMIILTIIIAIIFFVTTLPMTFNKLITSLFNHFNYIFLDCDFEPFGELYDFFLSYNVSMIMLILKIAFFMYCRTSTLFRKEFIQLIKTCRIRRVAHETQINRTKSNDNVKSK